MKTIRLIHNLPRSGGTIISKSLGAQKNVVLLSEIHPEGVSIRKKMGLPAFEFDPIWQSQIWFKLFEDDEYKRIFNSNLKFEEKIDIIYEKTESANKKLIIRDWAFADFFGRPFIEPSYKNSLLEILNKKFQIINIYIIRHPLKFYSSCYNFLSFFRNDYNFDFILKGYRSFFHNSSKDNICVFENFILETEKSLRNICNLLKIDYDDNYQSKLEFVNLTGDINAKNSVKIHNKDSVAKKKIITEDILNEFKNHPEFIKLMQDLKGYFKNE